MAATTAHFDRMVPAAPETVGAVRRELRRWARRQGAAPAVQANVALAFSEACTMVIGPEAPPAGREGPLMVEAWRDNDQLGVRVSHPSEGVSPVGLGYGFGLALMARVCDRFEVRRRDGRPGKAVEMAFSLPPQPAPGRSSRLQPSRSTTRR
jgi:anti-sigma regulatory factor (Ser/Thr protein kinase)